jgi:perosamine synthetase
MTWRWQPPVLSPVSSRALVRGMTAAMRLHPLTHGNAVHALCKRYGALDALLTNSGTAALTLALRKLVPANGVVGFPAYACVDLTSAALGAGVRVRLYDLNPDTLSPDIDSLTRMLHRGVDAVVVAHLYGYPADVVRVQEAAAQFGVTLIEDAAQGAGGELCGKLLGSFGELSTLSFGRGKGMTSGSGGAVLVRTTALSDWVTKTRLGLGGVSSGGMQVVTLAAQSVLANPALYRLPASIPALKLGEMVYHPPVPPRSMSAAAASLLCAALDRDREIIEQRKQRARELLIYVKRAEGIEAIEPIAGGESGFLRLAIRDIARRKDAAPTIGAMRGYPLTLDQHSELRPMLLAGERAECGSIMLREGLFTLPTHSHVAATDLARIGQWLASGS